MVKAEAALLYLLLRRSKKAIALEAANDAVRADRLFVSIRDAVLNGRKIAAQSSIDITGRRILDLGIGSRVPKRSIVRSSEVRAAVSAEIAAHGATGRWLSSRLDPSKGFKPSFEWGRIAASETVDAFTATRREMLDRLPPDLDLWKIWQTSGDRRVCDRCLSVEGEVVRVRESFSLGEAPLHAKCRCSYTIFSGSDGP